MDDSAILSGTTVFSTGGYQRVLVLMKQRGATVLFSWRASCLDWELLSLIGTIIHLSHTSWFTYRLTLGCRKYTRGSYQYCARAKPESGTDN